MRRNFDGLSWNQLRDELCELNGRATNIADLMNACLKAGMFIILVKAEQEEAE